MKSLRVVRDETPPLSDDELHARGNELASQARMAAIEAVRESMISEFLQRGKSLTPSDLRRWRDRAKTAREAWAEVEALTDELIREVEKNRDQGRIGKKIIPVPDGSGRPGFYKLQWADDTQKEDS